MSNMSSACVPVSVGELYDKISILEIKKEKLNNINQKQNVEKELQELVLAAMYVEAGVDKKTTSELFDLMDELQGVNLILWDIEDEIRKINVKPVGYYISGKAPASELDRFVYLAQQVYIQNDKRSRIKKKINVLVGSDLIEEKSYV